MIKNRKKPGFTLAEALMTLIILGVIAAMVTPAIITNSRDKGYVAGLKKSQAVLNNAVGLADRRIAPLEMWTWTNNETLFTTYFAPNLNVMTDCKTDDTCFGPAFKTIAGTTSTGANGGYKVILADGSRMAFVSKTASTQAFIYVDVNGHAGPNILGKDVFVFVLSTVASVTTPNSAGVLNVDTAGLYTHGFGKSRNILKTSCESTGESCATLVILDGDKMNY